MKYTKENLTAVLIKHLNEPCVKSVGILRACSMVAEIMFLRQYPEDEDAIIVRHAIRDLNTDGFFKFDE